VQCAALLFAGLSSLNALTSGWVSRAKKERRPKPTPLHLLGTKQKEKLDLAAELFPTVTSFPRNRANLESRAVNPERMATLGPTESLSRERVRLLLKNQKAIE
jgi:hypothetical protein